MVKELDTVILARDIPEQKLRAGRDARYGGANVHSGGAAYEVEFVTLGGETPVPGDAARPTRCGLRRAMRSRTRASWLDRLPGWRRGRTAD